MGGGSAGGAPMPPMGGAFKKGGPVGARNGKGGKAGSAKGQVPGGKKFPWK